MKRRILALVVGLWAGLSFVSCGGYKAPGPPSGLKYRVLASQGITTNLTFGALYMINGQNDTIARVQPLTAGTNPGLMVMSPTRNIAMAFDASSNNIYASSTLTETSIGNMHLPGPTQSFVVPTAAAIAYAAVPSASISGFAFLGAVDVLDFTRSSGLLTIAVSKAQTVVADATGTRLLVFSSDSDSVTVLTPGLAVPPVDTSCYTNPPNSVCAIVPGFDRPVNAVVSGSTAYVLNCGPQCGGVQASIAVFDLGSLTITSTIPVDAATMALLSGSTLYVAGTPASAANNTCAGQTTAATICGRLDIVDLGSGTVTGSAVITDGYHDRMDLTTTGQIFIGSKDCTNIGNVNSPNGEVRGCLSIYKISDGSVIVPPDNGNVNGLQGFSTRNIEYVAEGGSLRVYDTTKDILLINNFVPDGTINIVGYIGDVKAIDFF